MSMPFQPTSSTTSPTRSIDEIVRLGSPSFFDKELTHDPWEREFLVFYEQFRTNIRRAIAVESQVGQLVLDLMELTKASTRRTGRRQIAMRETAMRLVTDIHLFATAVLSDTT